MSKFLLNLLLQISKALVNSEILFPYIRPGRPCGPLGLWPNQAAGLAAPAGQNPPRPAHLARALVASSREYVFPFGSRLLRWPPPPRLSVKRAPAVSSVPHLRPPELARVATASQPPRAAVIPHSEKEGTKLPYECPGCSNHTYSNNMIAKIHVQWFPLACYVPTEVSLPA
jgi:hypothetical protein